MNAISKKLLSFVIVLAMVLSMAPVITLPAAAATDPLATWNTTAYSGKFINATTDVTTDGCPFCGIAAGTTVTWNPVGGGDLTTSIAVETGKHYYFKDNTTVTNTKLISSATGTTNFCVYFNNKNIETSGYIEGLRTGMRFIGAGLTSNGSVGTATVTRTSGSSALFRMLNKRTTIDVYGGNYAIGGTATGNVIGFDTYLATMTIHDGTFTGKVLANGKSLVVNSGTINGDVQADAGILTIGNARINGGITVASGVTLTLSGSTVITGDGLTLASGVTADVTNLATTTGAIAVTGTVNTPIATGGDDTKAAMFKVCNADGTESDTLEVTNNAGTLTITEKPAEVLPEWSSDIPTRINQWTDFYGAQFTGEDVETAICPVCGATDVTWKAVSARPLPSAGAHVYFYSEGTTEITAGSLEQIGSSHSATHCIYLNNYTYKFEGSFGVKNVLNIFDDPDVAGGSMIDLDSESTTATYQRYSAFRLGEGADLNIYYGAYTCEQKQFTNASGTVTNPNGTALIGSYADGAQAYIYGATLQNTGYGEVLRAAHNVTVELENCTLNGGSGYVNTDESKSYGGNIYMTDGTVTLKNTTVTGGTATNGSVYVGGGTLKLAGTTSIATNGLTLGTDVYADATDLATTSGAIVVNGTKDQKIAVNGNADMAAMFTAPEGLEVTVEGTDLVLTEPEVADPGPSYADGDTTLQKINKFTAYYAEKFAAGGNVETTDCPVCGATSVTWRPKTSGGLTPRTENDVQVATHWYLGASWERSGSQEQLGGSHAAPLCVYLNGNTFKTEGRLLVKDQLNIFDNASNAGGIIKPTHNLGSESYTKLALFDVYGGELNIYGGQYESQQATVIAGQNINGTPVIESHHSDSVVNIYGGTFKNTGVGTVIELSSGAVNVTGGALNGGSGYVETTTVEEVTTATGNTLGGNVYITGGAFVLNGGTIGPATRPETNMATNGGNVYVAGGTFTLTSGTVQNGIANVGGNVYVAAEGTFAMNGGLVTGGKANDTDSIAEGGGNVFNRGTFTMTAGNITNGEATNDGGNVFNYRETGVGACTLSGGSITGGKATNGGNLFGRLATTLSGVNISDGTATNGGNLYTINSRITMSAGSVTGGKATNGGNVYVARGASGAPGQLRLSGGTVSGGIATGNGGNVYITDNGYSSLDLRGGTISGGVAGKNGGSVYVTGAGRIDMTSGTITGGTATNGGAVYLNAVEEDDQTWTGATLNMSGGSITGGVCGEDAEAPTEVDQVTGKGGNGGAVYVAADTTFNMTGGSITGGTVYCKQKGKADGGVTLTEGTGGTLFVKGTFNMSGENTSITGGTARDARGSGLYVTGKAYLSGGTITGTNDVTDSALIVTGGSSLVSLSGDVDVLANNGKAIRVISSGTLNIEPTWTGTAYAMIYSSAGWNMGQVIGRTVDGVYTADFVQCGTYNEDVWSACGEDYFSGKLYQYTNNGSRLFALADGTLQAAGGAFVNGNETTWCRDSAATIEEATKEGVVYDYMWLTGDVTMNGETITVDASGSSDVTLFGTGYVNGIDLANTDYKTNSDGLAVDPLSMDTIDVTKDYTFDGNRYIALQQDAWTFHCLDLKLSAITLRPNKDNDNGLYYKSTIVCDQALAETVDAYGVVLSKQDMPTAEFTTDYFDGTEVNENSWTEVTKDLPVEEGTTSAKVNSALVKGILKVTNTDDKNVTNGKKTVYANAYLAIDADGDTEPEYFMATNAMENGCSLFDVLNAINRNWTKYEANHDAIGDFYGFWATNHGLSAWDSDLNEIAAHADTLQN